MSLRLFGAVCALFGGLTWAARWALVESGAEPGAVDATYWAGLVLLTLGVLAGSAGLVSAATAWLRALVGLCGLLLAWSVLVLAHDQADGAAVEGVAGLVAVLLWTPGFRRPAASRDPRVEDAAAR